MGGIEAVGIEVVGEGGRWISQLVSDHGLRVGKVTRCERSQRNLARYP